jgi:hypothetical protein
MNSLKMIGNKPKTDWIIIALIGLLFQGFWALRMAHPSYMDAYYYATNGQRIVEGYGLSEEIIWQYLDEPTALPTPSHTYWMPMTSMLAAVGYWFSDQFRALQAPFWLMAGLLPLLTYQISRDLRSQRWQAWIAALFTASGGFYNNFYNQPSTFAPFAWFGGGCLWALTKGCGSAENGRYWWLIAGVMAGFGHLTRADGMLLYIVGGITIFFLYFMKKQWVLFSRALLFMSVGYISVMGGWFWRTWQVTGLPLSTVGTQTIFLTTYDDLFAYDRSFDFTNLLNWGWSNIMSSRLDGVVIASGTFVAVSCLIFLAPFVVWAWWRLSREKWLGILPVTLYTILLFVTMSLVFTFPGGRGGLFHSSAAIFPWTMALAAVGVKIAVDWMAKRLPHWQPEKAGRLFGGLFVGVAMVMSVSLGIIRTPELSETAVFKQIGAQLPDDAVVLVGDAPGFYYHTKLSALSVPNEPPKVLIQIANRYHITHLILDSNRPIPLDALYTGEEIITDIHLIKEYDGIKLYEFINATN